MQTTKLQEILLKRNERADNAVFRDGLQYATITKIDCKYKYPPPTTTSFLLFCQCVHTTYR